MLSALASTRFQMDNIASASSALSGSTALSGPSQSTSVTANESMREPQRRRSQRLSAKISAGADIQTEKATENTGCAATSTSVASSSTTAVNALAGNDSASVHEGISGEMISSEADQHQDDDDDDDDDDDADLLDESVDAEV